jgi:hypothetical protein
LRSYCLLVEASEPRREEHRLEAISGTFLLVELLMN